MKNKKYYITLAIALLIVVLFPKEMLLPDEGTIDTSTTQEIVQEVETDEIEEQAESADEVEETDVVVYGFRYPDRLQSHYEKHGIEMGFSSAEAYEAAAIAVVKNPESLHKLEAEDNDDVYYLESTNDFVIVSPEGYIRTYYRPSDGIAYFNRQ